MQKLLIVRHGKTEWNEKGLMQGSIDIELNENGINSAKELAKLINLDEIDVVISSPLKRAKQTAEILVDGKKQILFDEQIIERGFGDYEGKPFDMDLIFTHWNYKENIKEGNIECLTDLLNRAKLFLDDIKEKYKDKNIMIVSHGGFIKALHFCLNGYDENTDFLSFNPKNTTIYKYDVD